MGRTGVGKSTVTKQLLEDLVTAPDFPGIGLLDLNRDLALDVARGIPPEREEDVVLVDLGDSDFPIGIPFFQARGVSEEALVQTTFATVRSIFRESWSETRMADCVFALVSVLCRTPDATLLDVPRLFHEPILRRRLTGQLEDPVARAFWDDYEALSDASQRETARPILYRLRAFCRSRAVRNIVCQTTGLDFIELIDAGKIMLISLSGSEIQAEADLLGELIIARLHLAMLTRLERARETRRPFYLAIDESQHFVGESLPVCLREGRKLGLSLLLSTQYLEGWSEKLAEAVLGNVGTLIVFRCGPTDSRRLQHSLRPFTPEMIEDLDRYEAIAKLQISGITQPAFDFRTLPPQGIPNEATLERIRARSRQRYARPRDEVEAELLGTSRPMTTWEGIDVDEE